MADASTSLCFAFLLMTSALCLLLALIELHARKPHVAHRGFWAGRSAIARTFGLILGLGRWRTVCPDCEGTGFCARLNSRHPHSCCGDCGRISVPWDEVPAGFDGGRLGEEAIIGAGWVWGSLWTGIRFGFYRGPRRRDKEMS
jgi:hypothetical protein